MKLDKKSWNRIKLISRTPGETCLLRKCSFFTRWCPASSPDWCTADLHRCPHTTFMPGTSPSGRILSGIPAAHTILRLCCHFCPLCFLSCSEQRLWDEGHLFWQKGRSAPLRLSYSAAFNSALLWLTSLLGRALQWAACLCVCVCVWTGRLLKSWSFNAAHLQPLLCLWRGGGSVPALAF